jgi:glycosyltransferase involved in cell wall biosynthesis
VSVVIPTYNRAAFVGKAVDSVLNQTFADYEVIVVDDGSTDDTREQLDRYGSRIRYIYQENRGVSAARNTGITASWGEWLALLDSDDEWQRDYLAKQISQATKVPGLCMQSANCLFTSLNGKTETYFEINGALGAFKEKDYLLIANAFSFVISHGPWQLGSTIFHRNAATKAGLFDTTLTLSEDLDFMARVALQGPFGLIKEELVNIYRRFESTESLTGRAERDQLGARESDERIYQKLKSVSGLGSREHKALNRVMSANKRAIGNLVLQAGNKEGARGYYKQALFIDPSFKSIAKYVLSYLPTKATPV